MLKKSKLKIGVLLLTLLAAMILAFTACTDEDKDKKKSAPSSTNSPSVLDEFFDNEYQQTQEVDENDPSTGNGVKDEIMIP